MRRSVPWITWEAVTGVEGYYDTRWLSLLWSIQAKEEGVPKTPLHWSSNNSVVKDPLEEPGRTQLYVGLLSAWDTVDGDRILFPYFRGRAT